jgi:hypothetical protein
MNLTAEQTQDLLDNINIIEFKPKLYYNTFPKSGTHLANLIYPYFGRQRGDKPWLGCFRGNSWTTIWIPTEPIVENIKMQPEGTWYQGHMGYKPEIERAFYEAGVCMMFVYRDLRDVAVSLAYHIEVADNETKFHPGKEEFMALGSHEARLKAVIEGLGKWAGIIERWELYAPWLDVDWVMPMKYEDMRNKPKQAARKVIDYVISRTSMHDGYFPIMFGSQHEHLLTKSLSMLQTTEYSSSYRKGVVGGWKEEFTPEIKQLFKEHCGDWLIKLGYENEQEW